MGNLTYTPQYTSSATVVVTARNEYSTYSSLSMANEMAGVFSEVFQSDALREKILEDTGETIQGTITCSAIEETNLLVLNASSPDPRQAYLLINSALKIMRMFRNMYFPMLPWRSSRSPRCRKRPPANPAW